MGRWILVGVLAMVVGCKESSAPAGSASASASASVPVPESASATATASATASAPASTPAPATASASAPATATVATTPPTSTGIGRIGHPTGPCSCKDVRVGGVYPLQNGHAMPRHDQDATVLSIDAKACTAQVREARTGTVRTERCDSGFFDPPYINPAG